MRRAKNASNVDDRSDVRTVVATAGVGGGTDLGQKIGGGARGQCGDHALAMRIVEHQLICVLSKAWRLLGCGLVEALLLETNIETARQQRRARFQLIGIDGGNLAKGVEIFFQASAVEASLHQIL